MMPDQKYYPRLSHVDGYMVTCPTHSQTRLNLDAIAQLLSRRLMNIFLQDPSGQRSVHGKSVKFQSDPRWQNLILFYEYFHGDEGTGLWASHQTGWTDLIANLIQGKA